MRRFVFAILGGICLVSCVSQYALDDAQKNVRSSFINGNVDGAVLMIENFEKKNVYQPKDRLLLYLEKGTVYHFAGRYKESFASFEDAERNIENNYTKSIARGIQSFIVNDNSLVYDGEDYEDVYVNTFKALNFIHMNDLEASIVEARRMSYKIENLNIKHNGLSSALAKASTQKSKNVSFEPGKAEIQSSTLAHYLSTVLFTKSGQEDNARIEYDRFNDALLKQQAISTKPLGKSSSPLDSITNPSSFNTLVVAFCGRSPQKIQKDTRMYFEEADLYIKLSLPQLKMNPSQVQQVRVTNSKGEVTYLPLIEQMDQVAKEIYKIKEPIIYARTFVRVAAKIIVGKAAEKKAKKDDNELLAGAFNLLTKVGTELSEKADIRSWQTMPGEAYSFVMQLQPGEQKVKIEYLGFGNYVLHEETRIVNIDPTKPLELIETIYWN